MQKQVDRAFNKKNQPTSYTSTQRKKTSTSTVQFKDNRPQAITQRKVQRMANDFTSKINDPIQQKENNNTGLPDNLKTGIENLSGYSMNDVKVHYNSDKPAQLQAHAYAQGSDIHLGPGQEKHLPHEAWHVVQQKQGRVNTTLQMKHKININDDVGLEREADIMGAKALGMQVFEGHSDLSHKKASKKTKQLASFLKVKRISNNGSLYMGKNSAGAPSLAHGGGTNWYGPKATAAVYGTPPGGVWQIQATRALNLVDMSTSESVKWIMEETARRRGINGLSPNLTAALGNFDFAYAIPNAVAVVADNYLQYAIDSYAGNGPVWPGNHYGVIQATVDNMVLLAGNAQQVPLLVGSVIQPFAGHTGGNAVQLDNPGFMANPNAYRMVRKDATNLDAGFANALLNNLNDPNLFHGLYVPQGMKFGGWTGTKFEILIKNSPNNLAIQGQVNVPGNEPDLAVTNKTIGVDNSWLAWAWRLFGLNK